MNRHEDTRSAGKYFGLGLVLLCGLSLYAPTTAHAGSPNLAGVMLHPTDPSKSVAIVNGSRLRVGSKLSGLELTEIGQGHVKLRDPQTGHEVVLKMGTGSSQASKPGKGRAAGLRASRTPQHPHVGRTLARTVNPAEVPDVEFLERVNPARLVWMAYSALAQASLRQIHTAQELFAINDMNYDGLDQYAERLSELSRHRLVQADLANGKKFGYQFYIRSWVDDSGPHYECIAEPMRPGTRQPYYYMDETGVIRSQLYARAGINSPSTHE